MWNFQSFLESANWIKCSTCLVEQNNCLTKINYYGLSAHYAKTNETIAMHFSVLNRKL